MIELEVELVSMCVEVVVLVIRESFASLLPFADTDISSILADDVDAISLIAPFDPLNGCIDDVIAGVVFIDFVATERLLILEHVACTVTIFCSFHAANSIPMQLICFS
jgi:hypothetical protein